MSSQKRNHSENMGSTPTPDYIMSLENSFSPKPADFQKSKKRKSSSLPLNRDSKAVACHATESPAPAVAAQPLAAPSLVIPQTVGQFAEKSGKEPCAEPTSSPIDHFLLEKKFLSPTEIETQPLDLSAKKKRHKPRASGDYSCICKDEEKNKDRFMIECSGCEKWFHGECVNVSAMQADSFLNYYCRECAKQHGEPTKKPRTNMHRHNAYEKSATGKPTQSGTPRFMEELQKRQFSPIETVLDVKRGFEIDVQYLEENGFERPILIREKGGLEIVIPGSEFYYKDVVQILGGSREVIAIDVQTQEDGIKLTLDEFLKYMQTPPPRNPVLNIISLEFSNTELAAKVIPPLVVRELSWADQHFPELNDVPPESPYAKPEVQKYCLMSAQDSYTDFHIDFGGTSVWYHIFKGKKIFYLIAPTDSNLEKYEEWMKSDKQSERFLGAECHCYKLELNQGETILMPSGWIHAVYTPEDSLVFGGNFLHHLGVEMQLKINKMEDRLKTPLRYRFPHFYTACWYALNDMTDRLADFVEEHKKPRKIPKFLTAGCKCLYTEFLDWMGDDEGAKTKRHEVPETIDPFETMKRLKRFLKKLAML